MFLQSIDAALSRFQRLRGQADQRSRADDVWDRLAELGVLGLLIDERHGGSGAGFEELSLALYSAGRQGVSVPLVEAAIIPGRLIAALGTETQAAELLPAMASGRSRMSFAHAERGAQWFGSVAGTSVEGVHTQGAWSVTGRKIAVVAGDVADAVLVPAMQAGLVRLFLVRRQDARVSPVVFHDGLTGADLEFVAAPAEILGTAEQTPAALADAFDLVLASSVFEAVGLMEGMLRLTIDHLNLREQFGVSIGTFQALQHRAADMFIELEQAKSMALYACAALTEPKRAQRSHAVRSAKFAVDRGSRMLRHEAMQLHGGIGMTAEYALGAYFKRATVLARALVDEDWLLDGLGRDAVA
jgi:alkylation response protein AidB-like acyl-CoA dehydrogenase